MDSRHGHEHGFCTQIRHTNKTKGGHPGRWWLHVTFPVAHTRVPLVRPPLPAAALRRLPWPTVLSPVALSAALDFGRLSVPGWRLESALSDFGAFGARWLVGRAHQEGVLRRLPRYAVPSLAPIVAGVGLWYTLTHDFEEGHDLDDMPFAQPGGGRPAARRGPPGSASPVRRCVSKRVQARVNRSLLRAAGIVPVTDGTGRPRYPPPGAAGPVTGAPAPVPYGPYGTGPAKADGYGPYGQTPTPDASTPQALQQAARPLHRPPAAVRPAGSAAVRPSPAPVPSADPEPLRRTAPLPTSPENLSPRLRRR